MVRVLPPLADRYLCCRTELRMRAVWYGQIGAARDVLIVGEMPDPSPAASEVRVRVHASGVNPSDVKSRAGRPIVKAPATLFGVTSPAKSCRARRTFCPCPCCGIRGHRRTHPETSQLTSSRSEPSHLGQGLVDRAARGDRQQTAPLVGIELTFKADLAHESIRLGRGLAGMADVHRYAYQRPHLRAA